MTQFDTEYDQLRKEIQFLKDCQVKYFALSVTAAGAIAGFADKSHSLPGGSSVYLAPLLVVIPCWWIFLDKGTTISRIVAYLRLLEKAIQTKYPSEENHIGWENALDQYRKYETGRPWWEKLSQYLLGFWYGLRYVIPLATTHRYWCINWWTFAGLTGAACWLALLDMNSSNSNVWYVAALISAVSVIHNLTVVGRLTKGSYSYSSCFARWQNVLPDYFRSVQRTTVSDPSISHTDISLIDV